MEFGKSLVAFPSIPSFYNRYKWQAGLDENDPKDDQLDEWPRRWTDLTVALKMDQLDDSGQDEPIGTVTKKMDQLDDSDQEVDQFDSDLDHWGIMTQKMTMTVAKKMDRLDDSLWTNWMTVGTNWMIVTKKMDQLDDSDQEDGPIGQWMNQLGNNDPKDDQLDDSGQEDGPIRWQWP